MKFVDLFAGLGGFHMALSRLGHTCVFACEIDNSLKDLYERNFGISPAGDISLIDPTDIPEHDILCAGFPCQPFSKARKRNGRAKPELSDQYLNILRILEHHKPRFLIMENVPDLLNHETGATWQYIECRLRELDYDVDFEILSPHNFGIPQIRRRMYIVGDRNPLVNLEWPQPSENARSPSIESILEPDPPGARRISDSIHNCIDVWQEFLDQVPHDEKIPLPLWSMEFGATYPYQQRTPHSTPTDVLKRDFLGSHGRSLSDAVSREEVFARLPSHARRLQNVFPKWKIDMIEKNRLFYRKHREWIDGWMEKIKPFPSSFQKFEWNCNERDPRREHRVIRDLVIQTRPSGVRVKRRTTAPSLIAMTATQVPIIGWEARYMTVTECKRLQSIDDPFELPKPDDKAYSALGNAVNVSIASRVAKALTLREVPADVLREPESHLSPKTGTDSDLRLHSVQTTSVA